MLKVGVLYGGRSEEHDVSRCSAASVIENLDKDKYEIIAIGIGRDGRWYPQEKPEIVEDRDFGRILSLKKNGFWLLNHFEIDNKLILYNMDSHEKVEIDLIFPVIHGTNCEDGSLQGLLDLAMVPYVGADTLGSSVAMDKDVAKRILRDGGVPVVPWILVEKKEWIDNPDEIEKRISSEMKFPLFVKPSNCGSSIGVKKVKSAKDISNALNFSFQYDNRVLVENGIDAREIECAVLGNENPEASITGEVVLNSEFYSYEAKYIDSDGAVTVIPSDISDSVSNEIRDLAVKTYKLLNCKGMARVDFFLDKKSDNSFLNEINTLPGFTSISMYPKLWAKSGVDYVSLLDKLIALAIERHKSKLDLITEI